MPPKQQKLALTCIDRTLDGRIAKPKITNAKKRQQTRRSGKSKRYRIFEAVEDSDDETRPLYIEIETLEGIFRKQYNQEAVKANLTWRTNPKYRPARVTLPKVSIDKEQPFKDIVRHVGGGVWKDCKKGTAQWAVKYKEVGGRPIFTRLKLTQEHLAELAELDDGTPCVCEVCMKERNEE